MIDRLDRRLATRPRARYVLRRLRINANRMRGDGALPGFVVIGEKRTGTTAMYVNLVRHDQVRRPLYKEIYYFDNNFHRGEGWYRAHFPTSASLDREGAVTFEATPYYFFHPHAARRMARTLPDAKLVVLLRNPIDRALSHYALARSYGAVAGSFEEAIDDEEAIVAGETARLVADDGYRSRTHRLRSFVSRGRYAEQLERWFTEFRRDQILVVKAEGLFDDPGTHYPRILDFLGLSRVVANTWPRINASSYAGMRPETRARLVEYFRPHNARLCELLGVDFDWDR